MFKTFILTWHLKLVLFYYKKLHYYIPKSMNKGIWIWSFFKPLSFFYKYYALFSLYILLKYHLKEILLRLESINGIRFAYRNSIDSIYSLVLKLYKRGVINKSELHEFYDLFGFLLELLNFIPFYSKSISILYIYNWRNFIYSLPYFVKIFFSKKDLILLQDYNSFLKLKMKLKYKFFLLPYILIMWPYFIFYFLIYGFVIMWFAFINMFIQEVNVFINMCWRLVGFIWLIWSFFTVDLYLTVLSWVKYMRYRILNETRSFIYSLFWVFLRKSIIMFLYLYMFALFLATIHYFEWSTHYCNGAIIKMLLHCGIIFILFEKSFLRFFFHRSRIPVTVKDFPWVDHYDETGQYIIVKNFSYKILRDSYLMRLDSADDLGSEYLGLKDWNSQAIRVPIVWVCFVWSWFAYCHFRYPGSWPDIEPVYLFGIEFLRVW